MERMTALLVELYQGRMPPWLAPVQACVLPVSPEQGPVARGLAASLVRAGLRVLVEEDGSLGSRIRQARLSRAACVAVIGANEAESGQVDVLDPVSGERRSVAQAEFVRDLAAMVRERSRVF